MREARYHSACGVNRISRHVVKLLGGFRQSNNMSRNTGLHFSKQEKKGFLSHGAPKAESFRERILLFLLLVKVKIFCGLQPTSKIMYFFQSSSQRLNFSTGMYKKNEFSRKMNLFTEER